MAIPYEAEDVNRYLEIIDGLLITGGDFDIDPALFGETSHHPKTVTNEQRTSFEMAILGGALEMDMPVLGICGGQQLLHVALGGALIQHIDDEIDGALAHEQPNPRDQAGHRVKIVPDTMLHEIVGTGTMNVNSAHHQAARGGSPGIVVNALADDGVIEGIEAPEKHFCLGVQWHPEFLIDGGDMLILKALVAAAGNGK